MDKDFFKDEPVLVINPDGTINNKFESVSKCAENIGVGFATIIIAIKTNSLCRGFKIIYEDTWSPAIDYSYSKKNKIEKVIKKEKKKKVKYKEKMTSDEKELYREMCRKRAKERNEDPNSKFGRGHKIPIVCINTNEHFSTIREAADKFDERPSVLSIFIQNEIPYRGMELKFDI